MTGTAATEHISAAGKYVRTATDSWDATDLGGIGNCVSALEHSAAELTLAGKILNELPLGAGRQLTAALIALKRDTGRLERLVDASSAFLRSAPGAGGDESPEFYRPGGLTLTIPPAFEFRGMQG